MYTKLSLKGAWSGHVNHINVGGHQPYFWSGWSKNDQILYTGRLYYGWYPSIWRTNHP